MTNKKLLTEDIRNVRLKAAHRRREVGDRQFVTALARGLAILRCYRTTDGGLARSAPRGGGGVFLELRGEIACARADEQSVTGADDTYCRTLAGRWSCDVRRIEGADWVKPREPRDGHTAG